MSRSIPIAFGLPLLALAACATPFTEAPPPAAPALAAPAANIRSEEVVGRWGLASYHKDSDRARTETAARGQCGHPYTIAKGPTGGVMMHLADSPQPSELMLKAGADGKSYVGPAGPAPDAQDREVVTFDGRLLILRWVDPEIAGRYGTMVYVRCGPRA